jgi:hypothetical protein
MAWDREVRLIFCKDQAAGGKIRVVKSELGR